MGAYMKDYVCATRGADYICPREWDAAVWKPFDLETHPICGNLVHLRQDEITDLVRRATGDRHDFVGYRIVFQDLDANEPAKTQQARGAPARFAC